MKKEFNIAVLPQIAANKEDYLKHICENNDLDFNSITGSRIIKKSIDARQRTIKVNLKVEVFIGEEPKFEEYPFQYQDVSKKEALYIIGAGPAGLFAALRCLEIGRKPVVIERGKKVQDRKKDIAKLHKEQIVNPESNYCFGEGGAGTYSDGKLYTRSKKRGNVDYILHSLVAHGANPEILYEAHPHIGTDKLIQIIANIRKTIQKHGGVFRFDTKLTSMNHENGALKAIELNGDEKIPCRELILATGHSARDVYAMLFREGVMIEAKGFAMGVRVEHPQHIIDRIQYHGNRGKFLPAAAYNLVTQVNGRGVYSFCMCPGGQIVPAMTAPGETVVNGMSSSQRNSKFANSGIVVEIRPEDIVKPENHPALNGLVFQRELETLAFQNGGRGIEVPAQRLADFVNKKISDTLPECSYLPGVVSSPMHFWLPEIIGDRLREGFRAFGKKMKGFLTNHAIITGVESRTSSPVKVPRDYPSFQHPQIKGLYPCGEGAGHAGGIVSSAMDGVNCASRVGG